MTTGGADCFLSRRFTLSGGHPMFVIAGVTGHVGSVVASTLLDGGRKVRVIVRDQKKGQAWQRRGAEVAVADLADAAALEQALAGAEGVFALVPPDFVND